MTTKEDLLDPLAHFTEEVREAVTRFLELPGRRVACLDADGTLWAADIGEAFLRWLAEGGLLPGQGGDADTVWLKYEDKVRQDLTGGYAWAVQCMAGLSEGDVVRWCRQLAAAWPNYRPQMRGLIRFLRDEGAEVYIVSASNRWVVEAAAPRIGVDPACTIAMATQVENGVLTDRLVPPPICGPGKIQAILERVGCLPGLAMGDGMGDLAVLEAARYRVVVGPHDRETELVRHARLAGWPVQVF